MTDIISRLDCVDHHPAIEDLVDILANKTNNDSRGYFRVEVAYFLAKMASAMRATINTLDRGEIPTGVYSIALAPSGFGKGHSVNILENHLLGGFEKRFLEDTFPYVADQHLWKMAIDRAACSGKSEDDEKTKLDKELATQGTYPFTFPKATPAALEQIRQCLLLSGIGSINLQVDEVGSNFARAEDMLPIFLELYDQGYLKHSITKNTSENVRASQIKGKTPTNALLFGTPSKLFDGGQTEEAFYAALETGYARRCFFGWGHKTVTDGTLTPGERYKRMVAAQQSPQMTAWFNHFTLLADPGKFLWKMDVPESVGILLTSYQMHCEKLAAEMGAYEEIKRAEMEHRYFKALKLAGTLAFIDESSEVTEDHLLPAIRLAEESGEMFSRMITREKPYAKLAKYIASRKGDELTHADLDELPFYKSSQAARKDMMSMAMSYGVKNHIIIRKSYLDADIEVFSGETLEETDLDQMILSYSDDMAYNYMAETAPFTRLHELTQAPDMHWCNHRFETGHRAEANVVPGFNMLVFDCDGTVPLATAQDLMSDYAFLTTTTKRHTPDENRFNLIMPITYRLALDQEDYEEFMANVLDWLPFEVDPGSAQRARTWRTNPGGTYQYNDGAVLDCLWFIPRTKKNAQYRTEMQELGGLDNLERWFAQRMSSGNRNAQMIKFALALADTGIGYSEIERALLAFNNRLPDPLPVDALQSTILVAVAKKMHGVRESELT